MTWLRLKGVFFKHLRLKESWVIFFILGIIMMNYPFISIFNKPVMLFGIPLLYLYLLVGWVASIFVVYLFIKALSLPNHHDDEGERR
jgi:hypothetical protein